MAGSSSPLDRRGTTSIDRCRCTQFVDVAIDDSTVGVKSFKIMFEPGVLDGILITGVKPSRDCKGLVLPS